MSTHVLCVAKTGDGKCACPTCYPIAPVERNVRGALADLGIAIWRSGGQRDASDMAYLRGHVLRAVSDQLRPEYEAYSPLAEVITDLLLDQQDHPDWSLSRFKADLLATGVDVAILDRGYYHHGA